MTAKQGHVDGRAEVLALHEKSRRLAGSKHRSSWTMEAVNHAARPAHDGGGEAIGVLRKHGDRFEAVREVLVEHDSIDEDDLEQLLSPPASHSRAKSPRTTVSRS